ncbi:MAG TPA: ribbon-helix-helix domain-containing protein [Rubrivivax sp.]|jgi:predicted DNA-binding ribbon-helix-helix protein|nr:ribbon-helix-helix domain-containing protein [Rubrivivax sp.]
MCEYFVKADPILYEQRTRSIRIHGVLTSIRLENMVWDVLAAMAEAERCSTNSLIVQFHDEILAHRGEVPNFASFLRVTGMRFLRRKLIEAERATSDGAGASPNAPAHALPRPAPRVVPLGARS